MKFFEAKSVGSFNASDSRQSTAAQIKKTPRLQGSFLLLKKGAFYPQSSQNVHSINFKHYSLLITTIKCLLLTFIGIWNLFFSSVIQAILASFQCYRISFHKLQVPVLPVTFFHRQGSSPFQVVHNQN